MCINILLYILKTLDNQIFCLLFSTYKVSYISSLRQTISKQFNVNVVEESSVEEFRNEILTSAKINEIQRGGKTCKRNTTI